VTRIGGSLAATLALVLLTSACGKYGRPHRVVRPPPAEAVEAEIADEEADAFDPDGPGGEPPESFESAVEEEEMGP